MVNKRTRISKNKKEPAQFLPDDDGVHNRPPTEDSATGKKHVRDAPKRFLRIMQQAERLKEAGGRKVPVAGKSAEKKQESHLTQLPGESLTRFVKRVDESMREGLMRSVKEGRTSDARKKRRGKRQLQLKAKKLLTFQENDGREFSDLQDHVKFGEVAQAPPNLPKLKAAQSSSQKNAELGTFLRNRLNAKTSTHAKKPSSDDELDEEEKPVRKNKESKSEAAGLGNGKGHMKNLSAADRRIVEEERRRAVESYRNMKAVKVLTMNR